jgi:hypothetical protein
MDIQYKIKKYTSKLQNTKNKLKKNMYNNKIKIYKKLLGGNNGEYDINYMDQLNDNLDKLMELAEEENSNFWNSNLKENNYEYEYPSQDENDFRTFKSVKLKNIKLIHYAILNFSSYDYSDFWKIVAKHDNLWKIQLCDECGEKWAGKTPLHIAAEKLIHPKYSDFWEYMASKKDLWKIQMTDSSGKGWAGKTPLHIAAENLSGAAFCDFWMIITTDKKDSETDSEIENEDLLTIQMSDASGDGYAGKTVLHTLVTNLKHNDYVVLWIILLKNENLWKIQMFDSSGIGYAGKTPLHIAVENFYALDYKGTNIFNIIWCGLGDFIGLMNKTELWKIQMTGQSGENCAGKTPLHLLLDFLNNYPKNLSKNKEFQNKMDLLDDLSKNYYISNKEREEKEQDIIEELKLQKLDIFFKVLEYLSDTNELWMIKMHDSCGKKNAGKTPLHQFIENFEINHKKIDKYYRDDYDESNQKYFEILLNLAKKENIWKVQLSDLSGKNYAGKTPLHIAAHTIYDSKYLPFWNYMIENYNPKENLKFWNIEITKAGGEQTEWKNPVNYMIEYLSTNDYISFWLEHGKDLGPILKENKAFKIEAPFLVKENLYALLFPNYRLMNSTQNEFDYYISSHGSMTGDFFKLPSNINLIFLTKSFTPAFVSELSEIVSGHMNHINTTINMCRYNNILRNYNSNDIVPNINLSFFDLGNIKYIEGIISNPDMALKTHFKNDKIKQYKDIQFYSEYNKKQNIRDDIGIFKNIGDKSNIKDSLFNLINNIKQKINDGSLENKNYTIILGPCRVSRIEELKFENLCNIVKKINKSQMKSTRYDSMCDDSDENTLQDQDFKLEKSFASPNFEDEIRLFDQDIQYALSLESDNDIRKTQTKLLNYELIKFEEIINVYEHIVKNQKNI